MSNIARVEEVVYQCPISDCDWSATQSYQRIDISYQDIEEMLYEHITTHNRSMLSSELQAAIARGQK